MKLRILAIAILGALTLSGCMTVHNGDKVFAISAQKFIIGASIDDAEAEIPAGATVLHVMHIRGPIFGLYQRTYIAGTK